MRIKLEVDNTGLSDNVLHCSFSAHYFVDLLVCWQSFIVVCFDMVHFLLVLLSQDILLGLKTDDTYYIFLLSYFYVSIPGH